MTKTDELIKKSIKEYLQTYSEQIVHANIDFLEEIICGYLETKEFQCLKEQIKKDEIIKGLSGEKIEDIPTVTSTEYIPGQEKVVPLTAEGLLQKYADILNKYIIIDHDDKPFIAQNGIMIILTDYLSEAGDWLFAASC